MPPSLLQSAINKHLSCSWPILDVVLGDGWLWTTNISDQGCWCRGLLMHSPSTGLNKLFGPYKTSIPWIHLLGNRCYALIHKQLFLRSQWLNFWYQIWYQTLQKKKWWKWLPVCELFCHKIVWLWFNVDQSTHYFWLLLCFLQKLLVKVVVNETNVVEIAGALVEVTNHTDDITADGLDAIADTLSNIATVRYPSREVSKQIL